MVVALAALFVALGGTVYAAAKIDTRDLAKGAVTSKKLAAGAVKATKLDGAALGPFVRSANAAISGDTLTGTAANATVAEATIEAPRSGFVQITGSADVFSSGADAGIACAIAVDGAEIDASDRVLLNTAAATTDDHIDNCATNVTAPVSPGSHTVGLVFSGVNGASVDERTLDVLFVPYGASG